jgi:hypothetical protein
MVVPVDGNMDWLFQVTIVTVLVMWVGSFGYSILNPISGDEVFRTISVGAPGLIGTLYAVRFKAHGK